MGEIPDLDHVAVTTRDIAALHAAYERLGFRLTPLSQQAGALRPGEPDRPWGTGNRCAFLRSGYLELLGIVDPSLPLNRLDQFLARYEGMHVLVFGTRNAEATAARLGVEMVSLAREVEGVRVAFRLARTSFPEGRVQFCQHLSREVLWAPRWLDHPNGAVALAEAFVEVADPEEAAARYAKALGIAPVPVDGGFRFRLASGALTISGATDAPTLPFMAGFAVAVENLDLARRLFDKAEVPYAKRGDELVVERRAAGGATCIFRGV
jgi:catechol 2,3-dioxygenase-like lactoylglutathione lyase family enzyme